MWSKKLNACLAFLVTSAIASLGFAQDIIIVDDSREAPILTEEELAGIIEAEVIDQSGEDYSEVNVEVSDEGVLTRMNLYLLFAETWTLDRMSILLDETGTVLEVQNNPPLNAAGPYVGVCPDTTVDIVYATKHDEIPTAVDGVTQACQSATNAGYNCHSIVGSGATVNAYKDWLACDLLAFGNIGHGSPDGIWLEDGFLDHTWFSSLPEGDLEETVVYFNSCQVHNDPLLQAVIDADARTYIGGIVNLWIGPSEAVFKCFWNDVLLNDTFMGATLDVCEYTNYPDLGAHGFTGDAGPFIQDPNADIVGFEDPSLWTANVSPLTSSSNATEGNSSLSVPASGYVILESADISLDGAIEEITFDINLPSPQANPWWAGEAQLLIEIPSQGIYNLWVSNVMFDGLALETWHTMSFDIPQYISDALAGTSYDDLTVKIVVNVPQSAGDYLLDNLQIL